ncbi:hypothetical protein ACHHYP_17378 [Achlya hypogyna]|uniref:Uncharacterized protein n=1 Tax=Achlya hypogyna TaxID=1202772 RepID=A0A1V9Y4K8_ACHHY|nr:hypothetical protein ACHHYP_17378 [Achlya hypogyna]
MVIFLFATPMRSAQNSVISEYKVAATPRDGYEGDDDSEAQAQEFAAITSGLEHPQVTFKALAVGTLMGIFVSVLAMYYGLKLGVTPSLNVLAGVGGFMLTKAMTRFNIFGGFFSVQENVVIQTCAVACMSLASQAGFTSGVLALTEVEFYELGNTTFAGNLPTDVINFNWIHSFAWCASIALFGFFISFPLRRKFIIDMRLLFPSGTATAHMIKTLHTSKEAVEYQWNVLLKSGVISYCWSIFLFCFDGLGSFPIFGIKASDYTWTFDWAPGTYAIALMLPFRVMYSIFIGNIVSWAIMTPYLEAYKLGDWFTAKDVTGLKGYYTFTAVAIICVDAVYSIVNIGIILVKAYMNKKTPDEPVEAEPKASSGDSITQSQRQAYLDKIFDSVHIPAYIWVSGLIIFAAVSVVVISQVFPAVHWYKILVCCLLIPIFAVGIVQGVGMTDWNISSAVGKLILFVIGSWSEDGSIIASLLLCQMVIVGCSQAADLMQDFKTGYLVGASAKSMIVAQIFGACMSCIIVPTVWVVMNEAFTIPGDVIKAPYGEIYRALAITATVGLSGLPTYCGYFMLVGAIYTVVFNLYIDMFTSSKNKTLNLIANHCPIPMAVAIGMIVPAYFGLEGMIMAAVIAYWKYKDSGSFEKSQYVLAAGMLTGEGFSVLTQIIVSICGGNAPISVSYKKADGHKYASMAESPKDDDIKEHHGEDDSNSHVTVKALFVGSIVGIFVSVLAMYYSLKIGVTPSLNVLAGVGGFMLVRGLTSIGITKGFFSVQENVVIQTCSVACMSLASQAGFGSGVLGLTEAVYLKVGNETKGNLATDVVNFNWTRSFAWCASIALFGFFISFPLRRKFIIDMRLLFPSGTATAHMIKTLHTSKEVVEYQWNILLKSGVLSYCWSIFLYVFDGLGSFPIFGMKAAKENWVCDWAPGTYAIALMLPFRVMYSIFVGCVISSAIMTPWLREHKMNDWFVKTDVSGLKAYYTFTAVAIICVDAVYAILKIGYILIKAWTSKQPITQDTTPEGKDEISAAQRQAYLDKIFDAAKIPTWSWIGGLVLFAAVSVVVISLVFDTVHWYKILVCCLLIPIFAIGIVQGVGMTDWNISSAVGKLIIFVIGSWTDDGSIIASLLLCQMVIVGCSQAADLMQDFKTGYLVGASANSMIVAQIFGACMSCIIVPTVWVVMNNAFTIPGSVLEAPYGEIYRVLAITATVGLSGLPTYCGYFMLVGAIYTVVFNLYIDLYSESKNKTLNVIANYCPVPMPVAIGMVIPAYFGLQGMFMAAIIAYWNYKDAKSFEKAQYILAAGMLTGEGFSVLTQIVVSICGGKAPIQVSFAPHA